MTDKERKLVEHIEATAKAVLSFTAEYDLTMHYEGISLHSRGKMFYADQSHYRLEGMTNGQKIITVSRNDISETYFVDQKLISRANKIEEQSPIDILHGLSDIRDSFSSIDKETLTYAGPDVVDDRKVYHFRGRFRILTMEGIGKVRMPIEVDSFTDQESCLLLKRVWTQTGKGTLVNAHYKIMDINLPIDDSLFSFDALSPEVRRVGTMDISKTLFFSDEKNQGASMN